MAHWLIATAASLACGSCLAAIGEGEPYATVTGARLVRCQACMRLVFEAEPPADVWSKAAQSDLVPGAAADFVASHQAVRAVASAVRDGKLAALGSDQ